MGNGEGVVGNIGYLYIFETGKWVIRRADRT